MNIPDNYQDLEDLVTTEALTSNQILEIARAHLHEPNEGCAVCEDEEIYSWYDTVAGLLIDSQLQNMESEALTFLYDNLNKWYEHDASGTLERYRQDLGLHPKSEQRIFEEAAEYHELYVMKAIGDQEDELREEQLEILRQVVSHPKSTPESLLKWREAVHGEGYFCETTFEECERCEVLYQQALGKSPKPAKLKAGPQDNISAAEGQPSMAVRQGFFARLFGKRNG